MRLPANVVVTAAERQFNRDDDASMARPTPN